MGRRRGQGRAQGQVVRESRIANDQAREIVDAAPLPGAKIDLAVTAGFADGRVVAERAARDGHGRTNDGRIADRTTTRTGAGAAAQGLVPGKRAATDRGRAGTV